MALQGWLANSRHLAGHELSRLEAAVVVGRWLLCTLPILLLPVGKTYALAAGVGVLPLVALNLTIQFWLGRRREEAPPVLRLRAADTLCLMFLVTPLNLVIGQNHLNGFFILPAVLATVGRGMFGMVAVVGMSAIALFGNAVILHALRPTSDLRTDLWNAVAHLFIILQLAVYAYIVGRRMRQLQQNARIDTLTGADNYAGLQMRLRALVARVNRPLSLLVIDLDHFKAINDRYGHEAGNQVLRSVADRVRATAPPGADVARQGGEEFAVLLARCDAGRAFALAEQIRLAIAEAACAVVGGEAVMVTASIGVATLAGRERRLPRLVQAADAALYSAKRSGRNCCRLAPPLWDEGSETDASVPLFGMRECFDTAAALLQRGANGAYFGHLLELGTVDQAHWRVRLSSLAFPVFLLLWGGVAVWRQVLFLAVLWCLLILVLGAVKESENLPGARGETARLAVMTYVLVNIAVAHSLTGYLPLNGLVLSPIIRSGIMAGGAAVLWTTGYGMVGTLLSSLVVGKSLGLGPEPIVATVMAQVLLYAVAVLCSWLIAGILRESHERAVSDALTQLYNQGYFWHRLREREAVARKVDSPAVVLLMDLDDLKGVNDRFGHEAGDQLLRRTALVLREALPAGAVVARYGGDEFAALLPDIGADAATDLARCLLDRLNRHPDGAVKLCIGISSTGSSATAEGWLEAADAALYCAKLSGKNQVIDENMRYLASMVPTMPAALWPGMEQ